jgi:hypothetical protein
MMIIPNILAFFISKFCWILKKWWSELLCTWWGWGRRCHMMPMYTLHKGICSRCICSCHSIIHWWCVIFISNSWKLIISLVWYVWKECLWFLTRRCHIILFSNYKLWKYIELTLVQISMSIIWHWNKSDYVFYLY